MEETKDRAQKSKSKNNSKINPNKMKLGWNIKKETAKKTVFKIQDMIDHKINFEPDAVTQWNRLVTQICDFNLVEKTDKYHRADIEISIDGSLPIIVEVELKPIKLLSLRNKGQIMTFEQERWIFELITKKIIHESIIREWYWVSEASIIRIKMMFSGDQSIHKPPRSILGSKVFLSRLIKKEAWIFIKYQTIPFRAKDVSRKIEDIWKITINPKLVAKFIKKKLNLSFKKATSKPFTLDVRRQRLLQVYFWVKLAQQLRSWKWILNVDEATISKNTKNNYTWLIRGVQGSIKNIVFGGSLKLITTISSSGMSYTALTARTTNSEVFIDYLTELFKLLKTHEWIKSTEIILSMDNMSCHQSDGVFEYLNLNKVRYIFLPAYFPELAPVDFFLRSSRRWWQRYMQHLLT